MTIGDGRLGSMETGIILIRISKLLNIKGNAVKEFLFYLKIPSAHLSTAVAWREKKFKHFVFYKYFSLVLGLLKSRISEKTIEGLLNKLDFKLFHYKARVQPVLTIKHSP